MQRYKLSISTVLISGFLCHACFAQSSEELRNTIVSELTTEGYSKIVISRTLLGRTKIEANGRFGEREIIVSPNGQVLRDRFESYSELTENDAEKFIGDVEQILGRDLSNEEIESFFDEFEDEIENLTEEDLQAHFDEMDEDDNTDFEGDEDREDIDENDEDDRDDDDGDEEDRDRDDDNDDRDDREDRDNDDDGDDGGDDNDDDD